MIEALFHRPRRVEKPLDEMRIDLDGGDHPAEIIDLSCAGRSAQNRT